MLGADYYGDESKKQLVFFRQNDVLKQITPQQLKQYSTAISQNRMMQAADIIKAVCIKHSQLITKSVYFPFETPNEIKRHYTTGLGKITIPGSSIKGALRSCFGNHMINNGAGRPNNTRSFDELFGSINNNLMRFLQVTDVELDLPSDVLPMKIFSGDVTNNIKSLNGQLDYEGKGMWKHSPKGGHDTSFDENGFVFQYETCRQGAKGSLRLNWAKGLDDMIDISRKPAGYKLFEEIKLNRWMSLIRNQMASFIEKERGFYDKFYNEGFDVVFALLDKLEGINREENSVLLRLGAGTGYHAITGNWNYGDHTQTKQAEAKSNGVWNRINAIKYKTRKVAFGLTTDDEGEIYDFQLPGFVKITLQP